MPRVLLVGAGLTSAAIACRLADLPVKLSCWEKASRTGGRLTTHRLGSNTVDLGAQHLTCQMGEENTLFKDLISSGILRPVMKPRIQKKLLKEKNPEPVKVPLLPLEAEKSNKDDPGQDWEEFTIKAVDDFTWLEDPENGELMILSKPENYIAYQGTETIVKHLWKRSGLTPCPHHFLDELNCSGSSWTAVNKQNNKTENYDAVILTIPVPQLLGVYPTISSPGGNFINKIQENSDIYENLLQVQFLSSFSQGLLYSKPTCLGLNWKFKYFPDHPIIRYISVDTLRRDRPEEPTSICIQTQRSWSQDNLELSKLEAEPIILDAARELLNKLPEPDNVITHKWRFSQTGVPYPGSPGAVSLYSAPLLVGAGDSYTQSNVEGCLTSADIAVEILLEKLNLKRARNTA